MGIGLRLYRQESPSASAFGYRDYNVSSETAIKLVN
ncbi:hypothetical protein F441_10999 [Phytophthora nicotianae CJ01A1]|uniref:Uncharacterized protein n=5 Tax=Phytophthora nicotianae TaxID=4792 RepID=W2Q3S3_PHYN3|nr:hypothetical protein PPTG_23169 [Phytophthora nicotianae INRA-310]ETI44190.1 hypothetical protein F443_11087 [Phytophthora nicotianae P1569]ETK84198.1 hypothetical protein L915_10809 [Phytophthora nicotianae]ETO72838.1 hypothetical protein F444_11161 [Phytophthora nicotianae P1976]ETP14013.1 hypothetical protein F441_10999 [Phytophthora nicotianae CJ01A1]ETL37637.1 hypothetical protein L916_10700 [Phytophthora nicotianae]